MVLFVGLGLILKWAEGLVRGLEGLRVGLELWIGFGLGFELQ